MKGIGPQFTEGYFIMKKCLIISGGEYSPLDSQTTYEYVIACDRGVLNARRMNIRPDLIIGDFDSLNVPIPPEYADIPVNNYPIRKDDSDTVLATRIALDMNCFDNITIVCALGGRLDHTYANLQTLGFIASHGIQGELHSADTHVITHTGGEVIIPQIPDSSLSLFALSDICHDISINGSGYDVSHIDIRNTFPIGLSNYWNSSSVTISMGSGILLIIQSKYVDL